MIHGRDDPDCIIAHPASRPDFFNSLGYTRTLTQAGVHDIFRAARGHQRCFADFLRFRVYAATPGEAARFVRQPLVRAGLTRRRREQAFFRRCLGGALFEQALGVNALFHRAHGENLGARGLWGKSTMYEESAGIPPILAAPGIPAGKAVDAPASLMVFHPTVLDCAVVDPVMCEARLPGRSLRGIAETPDDNERSLLISEYHAAAWISAACMVRRGHYEYIHYTGCEPVLFDLARDPEEMRNLAADQDHMPVRAALEDWLREVPDPEATDRRAKADQARHIAINGGREAILATERLHGTPAPDNYRSDQ